MNRILTIFLLLCTPVLHACKPAADSKPLIVSTIKPVQALVYAIAGEQRAHWDIRQLLPDGASPHYYALKPSEMRTLETARLVFRIDSGLETFLNKPLAGLPASTQVIALASVPGIQHLPLRAEHRPTQAAAANRLDAHTTDDLHIWLNPQNAIAMSRAIAQTLGQADPAHQADYIANADKLAQRINQADQNIRQQLEPVHNKPYLAFHDAWQHFDRHYGLNFAGAVTLDISRQPGARHVQEVRQIIEKKQAVCLFQEPQFPPALVKTLVEGTDIRISELDPLGMKLPLDENTYITLLENASRQFLNCLE
jgi:zinc transport system substrate-binding protein